MARPALIIGLGGTGQWVLTYLKRELIEAYMPDRGADVLRSNGLPKGVRFLAFDTVKERVNAQGQQQELGGDVRHRKVGSVELEDATEYVYYGDSIRDAVDIIWKGDQAEFYQAYAPQTWLKESYPTFTNLPDAVMHAVDGAGAIRHVGRMALIKDLRKGDSKILGTINTAIQGIVDEVGAGGISAGDAGGKNTNRRLEVIFVNSLAGGTGAGIFVDIALWCHNILDLRFPGATVFRAFLVSPFAFTAPGPGADAGKMARSFAAWRELSRFLTVGNQNVCGTVKYDGLNIDKQINLNKRLFDVTYMIDPNRANNPLLPGHPEKNLYPSISQAIAAILDPEAGGEYSQDAINFAGDLGTKDAHCAFGCYTIKVPIYYHWQDFTTKLEMETLNQFLKPEFDGNGMAIGISSRANAEHLPADIGRAAVVTALQKANLPYKDKTYPNPRFWQNIANAIQYTWHEDGGEITKAATKFPSDGNWGGFGENGILDSILSHPDGRGVLDQMKRDFESGKVWDWVPLTDKPMNDLKVNPPVIERLLTDHYSDKADVPGSFKKSLAAAGKIQFELFAGYLRAMIEQELNGLNSDPRIAKGGKLGWVHDFLLELRNGLKDYQAYCTKVLNRAAEPDVAAKTTNAANTKLNDFKRHAGDQAWVTFWDNQTHPRAHQYERQYYLGQQAMANLKKENLLFVLHRDTAKRAEEFITNSLDDLDGWVKVFVTGGSHFDGKDTLTTNGVYTESLKEFGDNQQDYKDTQAQQSQLQYLGDVQYPEMKQEVDSNLAELTWRVAIDTNYSGLVLNLTLGSPLSNGRDGQNYDLSKGVKNSHEVLHKNCEQPFTRLINAAAPNTVFNELKKKYPQGGASLAVDIENKADPFWRLTPGGQGPYAPVYGNPSTGLIAVKADAIGSGNEPPKDTPSTPTSDKNEKPNQADQFLNSMLARLHVNQTVRYNIAKRHDPYAFTLMRTDNVIASKDFNVYQECKKAYVNQYMTGNAAGIRTNLEQYHIFPAEVHAAQYEREIAEVLRQNFSLLSPEIVGLLDDKEKVDNFFKIVALGYVRRQIVRDDAGNNGFAWVYQVEGGPATWLSDLEMTPIPNDEQKPYPFFINHVVYKSCDTRARYSQVNRIDWGQLHTIIWNAELAGTTQDLYKAQYEIPMDASSRNANLSRAADAVSQGKTDVVWPLLTDLALKKQADLAHLCESVLRQANKDTISRSKDKQAVI